MLRKYSVKHSMSENLHIKEQYDKIRKYMAELLRDVTIIADDEILTKGLEWVSKNLLKA